MAGVSSEKVCVVCGTDCSTGPRTKDASGRYYCAPCHEKAVKHVRAKVAGPAAPQLPAPPPPLFELPAREALPVAALPRRATSGHARSRTVLLIAGALLGLLLVGGAGVMVILRLMAPPAIVGPPKSFSNAQVSFQYPQQWSISEYPSLTPGEVDVTIEAGEDAHVRIYRERLVGRLGLMLDTMVDDVQVSLEHPYYGDAFSTWGSFAGDGKSLGGEMHGTPVTCRMFISQLDSTHVLRVVEVCPDSQERSLRTGFVLIRSSFAVH